MLIKNFNIKLDDLTINGNKIISIDGLQETVVEYETVKNAIGNGTIVTGSYMPQRDIVLNYRINKQNVDFTLKYFKPNKKILMKIGNRKINCFVTDIKINWARSFHNEPTVTLNLIAPDPFFYDVSDFGKNIAGIIPLFGFPWTFSPDNPVKFGYKEFTDKTIFENRGDDKVGLKLKIEATDTVENVKFENLTTGQFIKVNQELTAGDILEISTVAGNCYIKLNGTDIFDKIDRMSDFFQLDIGDNFLQYSADVGETKMNVYLYYSPKYLNGMEDFSK